MLFSALFGGDRRPHHEKPVEDCAARSSEAIRAGTSHNLFPASPTDAPIWDYIILGAGTAGACLANRLSSDPGKQVLVLEKGDFVLDSIANTAFLSTCRFMATASVGSGTSIKSKGQPSLNNRTARFNIAQQVGGGSAVNCCIYTRPSYAELADWNVPGWGGKELKPYYDMSEKHHPLPGQDRVDGHGYGGPWHTRVKVPTYSFAEKFLNAADRLGLPKLFDPHRVPSTDGNDKLEGPQAVGTFIPQLVQMEDGSRHHTGRAYLPNTVLESRPNLHVATNVTVDHVELTSSKRELETEGVWFLHKNQYYFARSKRVILCAGAVMSPAILQRSGIGAAPLLRELNIDVLRDVPAVGHIKDHLLCPLSFRVPTEDSLMRLFTVKGAFYHLTRGLFEYWRHGTGWMATGMSVEALAFYNADNIVIQPGQGENSVRFSFPDGVEGRSCVPDLEIMHTSVWPGGDPVMFHGLGGAYGVCGLCVYVSKPKSSGILSISSADPRVSPNIDPQLLTHPDDITNIIKGVRFALAVAAQMRHVLGYDIGPADVPGWDKKHGGWNGADRKGLLPPTKFDRDWDFLDPSLLPDQTIIEWVRSNAQSALHMACTAAMGAKDDPTRTVVDSSSLEVFGTKGLHVMDNSVMPDVLAVHPQATIVAMAEKAADILLQS